MTSLERSLDSFRQVAAKSVSFFFLKNHSLQETTQMKFAQSTRGNPSNKTDCLQFMSSLRDLAQLLLIAVILIASLVLYEMPSKLSETHLSSFIGLRCIAFVGFIVDVYLFLKLSPITSPKPALNEKTSSLNRAISYKPYPTNTYKHDRVTARCTSAPPILSASYLRTPNTRNPL